MAQSTSAQRGDPPALTLDNVVKVLNGGSVKWTQNLCVFRFRIPVSKYAKIEYSSLTSEEKWKASIDYMLSVDPTPSWRRIISAVDLDNQYSAASRLYQYAEPVTDPTLTPENVRIVLEQVNGLYGVCSSLCVPYNKRGDIMTASNYFISCGLHPTWMRLAGILYYHKEERALTVVRRFLHTPSPDPSLTVENMCEVLKGVDLDDFDYFDIPYSVRKRIERQYHGNLSECNRALCKEYLDAHPAPSWAHIAEGLFQSSKHDVLKQLERQHPIVISPARRMIACNRAIKEKGSCDERFVQSFLSGSPRSGKSSFKHRVVGRFRNTQASTGVAEKVTRVEVSRSTVQVGGLVWNELKSSEDEEAIVANKISINVFLQPSLKQDTATSINNQGPLQYFLWKMKKILRIRRMPQRNQLTSYYDETTSESTGVNPYQIMKSSSNRPLSSTLTPATATASVQDSVSHGSYKSIWTQYMSDVGGQPEFQELLPNLLYGPSLFYHVFRADQSLYDKVHVEYLHSNGESMVPYDTTVSTKDAILQFLSSVSSIGVGSKPQGGKQVSPKVLFIATHIDKLESEDKILEIDQELQRIIKETQAFKDKMIVYGSESCMLLPVNNLSKDDSAFQNVRAVVDRVVTGSDDYCISVPYTWSLFSITIQHLKEQVLSYDTCLAVGKECGIDTTGDMDDCLWFLHHRTGILRHFKEVPELCHLIVKDPQYIFDKVTDLIVNTFTFEKTGGDMVVKEEFSKKGIFSIESFERLTSDSDLMSSSELIKLFEYLRIVAPLRIAGTLRKYFLPCALVHVDPQEAPEVSPEWLPSIFFGFSSGYCPNGIFAALVADLLHMKQGLAFQWEFREDKIFRNQICFSIGPFLDRFRFTVSSDHVSVNILPSDISLHILSKISNHVRQQISSSLSDVIARLNYDAGRLVHRLAFRCPLSTCTRNFHLAYVRFDQNVPCALECSYLENKVTEIPTNCNVWLDETFVPLKTSPFLHSSNWSSPEQDQDSSPLSVSTPRAIRDQDHTYSENDHQAKIPSSVTPQSAKKPGRITAANCPALGKEISKSRMMLLRWTASSGQSQVLRLQQEMSPKWRDIGQLLCISAAQLDGWEEMYHHDPIRCIDRVVQAWMQRNSEQYPIKWEGLLKLLDDVQLNSIADQLEEAALVGADL